MDARCERRSRHCSWIDFGLGSIGRGVEGTSEMYNSWPLVLPPERAPCERERDESVDRTGDVLRELLD